jgi:hypothetical protein
MDRLTYLSFLFGAAFLLFGDACFAGGSTLAKTGRASGSPLEASLRPKRTSNDRPEVTSLQKSHDGRGHTPNAGSHEGYDGGVERAKGR